MLEESVWSLIMTITTIIGIAICAIAARSWYNSRKEYLRWLAYERAKQRWVELNSHNSKEEC